MQTTEFNNIESALDYIEVNDAKLLEDYKSSTRITIFEQDNKPVFATVYLQDNYLDALLLGETITCTQLKSVPEKYGLSSR